MALSEEIFLRPLVDPTPRSPFLLEDYEHPLNQETLFRQSGYSYEDVSRDLIDQYHTLTLSNRKLEDYFRWWLADERRFESVGNLPPSFANPFFYFSKTIDPISRQQEIAATSVSFWDKIRFEPPTKVNPERESRYYEVMRGRTCQNIPATGIFRGANINDMVVNGYIKIPEAESKMLPGGLFRLNYAKGSEIKFLYQSSGGMSQFSNGEKIVEFKGVSISIDPLALVQMAEKGFSLHFPPSIEDFFKRAVEKKTSGYRMHLHDIRIYGGRPFLRLGPGLIVDLSILDDLGVNLSNQKLKEILVDSSFRYHTDLTTGYLLNFLSELNKDSTSQDDLLKKLLPSRYQGSLNIQLADASYSLEPFKQLAQSVIGNWDVARVDRGQFQIQLNEEGLSKITAELPATLSNRDNQLAPIQLAVRIDRNAGKYNATIEGDGAGKLLSAIKLLPEFEDAGFTVKLKDLELREATDPTALIKKAWGHFEVSGIDLQHRLWMLDGGGIFSNPSPEYQLALASKVIGPNELPIDDDWSSVIIEGRFDSHEGEYQASLPSFKIFEGLEFKVEEMNGRYALSEHRVAFDVEGRFQGEKGFYSSIPFSGQVIVDGNKVEIQNARVPIKDVKVDVQSGGEVIPIIFDGNILGDLVVDFSGQEVRGPMRWQGDIRFANPEQAPTMLPAWIRPNKGLSTVLEYLGPFLNLFHAPNKSRPEKSGHQLLGVKNCEIFVKKIWTNTVGRLMIDLGLGSSQIEIAYPREERQPADKTAIEFRTPIPPIIISSHNENLDPADVYLASYHLDQETAMALKTLVSDSYDFSTTITGFKFNVPPDGKINLGGFPVKVPPGSQPVLDIWVHEGKVKRFHMYFTEPLHVMGGIKKIRGFYFDNKSGAFKLDLVNGPQDAERPPQFYVEDKHDIIITKAILKNLPFPPEDVERILAASDMSAETFSDDASGWMDFFLETLITYESSTKSASGEPFLLDWSEAEINVNSVQLNPGATMNLGGVSIEFGCKHDGPGHAPLNRSLLANNIITGKVSLKERSGSFDLRSMSKIHLSAKDAAEKQIFDVILYGGKSGHLEMGETAQGTKIELSKMDFESTTLVASPFSDHLDMAYDGNLKIRSLSMTQSSDEETIFKASFDAHLKEGELLYHAGSREAYFNLGPSPVHVETEFRLQDEYIKQAADRTFVGIARKPPAIVNTVFKSGSWIMTSPDKDGAFKFKEAKLTPGFHFSDAQIKNPRMEIFYVANETDPQLDIQGEFDWTTDRAVELPVSLPALLPELRAKTRIDALGISGQAHIHFDGSMLSVASKGQDRIRVTTQGQTQLENPFRNIGTHEFDGDFSLDLKMKEAIFVLDESDGHFPLRIEQLEIGNVTLDLPKFFGRLFLAAPFGEGYSGFRFKNGTAHGHIEHLKIDKNDQSEISGVYVEMSDRAGDKNNMTVDGFGHLVNGIINLDNMHVRGDATDYVNGFRVKNLDVNLGESQGTVFPE